MTARRFSPVLTRVELKDFSLYQKQRRVVADINAGVFCLAGANGLGKSTFLSAINYGLTGIVAEPGRKFGSMKEYYRYSLDYAPKYFDGRIDESDRETAVVKLNFTVADNQYQLTRNFFEPRSLRDLEIRDRNGIALVAREGVPGEDLQRRYENQLLRDCNLTSFEQFVFLQHYLASFDERRHLLFWDESVVVPALYLAFGLDASDADVADELRRKAERADSLARNLQWRATAARRELATLGGTDDVDVKMLKREHDSLVERTRHAVDQFNEARGGYDDAELKVAELSAMQTSLRLRYDETFGRRMHSHHEARLHPTIQDAVSSHECNICGASGSHVADLIRQALSENVCPLCGTPLVLEDKNSNLEELERLDAELSGAQDALASAQQRAARLREEVDEKGRLVEAASEALADFEAANASAMPILMNFTSSVAGERARLQAEIASATQKRDEERAKRDRYKAEVQPYQSRLATAYDSAERHFVPLFRKLAKSFIGLDLDIFLVPRKPFGYTLSLEVLGTRRRNTNQLSESQRFFLDIALRMALLQHMTGSSAGSLLVDTPEGSLDISYERRAGQMFADFVQAGYQIVMTANINASQLLVELAKRCGEEKMLMVRMTEWTPLSEVQAEAEDLFDSAYRTIEEHL